GMQADMIRFLDAKRREKRRQPQVVRSLAVPGTMRVREVIENFAPDAYHMIYVLDEEKNVQAVLAEDDLVDSVFEDHGMRWTLDQLIERRRA
ncbi:MAG: hypothetical protein WCC10_03080, partial [Tumebacillaceae bacterium]